MLFMYLISIFYFIEKSPEIGQFLKNMPRSLKMQKKPRSGRKRPALVSLEPMAIIQLRGISEPHNWILERATKINPSVKTISETNKK